MDSQFQWVEFYRELAVKLRAFKDKRQELIDKVKEIYQMTGLNMPTLERENQIVDIDPFTVFGLFNKSSMRNENRLKILSAIKDLFGVETAVPSSFDSIPVLNNQNATFYYWIGDRGNNDIDNLWDLFEYGLVYADSPSSDNLAAVSKYFDLVINTKGNGNSKVTMALYWIAPHAFLNLDSRNEWYIYESGKVPDDVVASLPKVESNKIASSIYFKIVERLRAYLQSERSILKNFKELSFEAWNYSTEVNNANKAEKKAENLRAKKGAGLADDDVDTQRYWLYAPGNEAVKWEDFYKRGIMGLGWAEIGELNQYSSKDEMKAAMKENIDQSKPFTNAALATWQFANEIRQGDIIFVKKGLHQLVGRGVVTSDYYFDDSVDKEYPHLRKVNWTHNGEWPHPGQAVLKTLTDITPYTDYIAKMNALFETDIDDVVEKEERNFPEYTPEKFLSEVYMDVEKYNTLVDLIKIKKNVILQGAPGVGKTYIAKRLAYSMIGAKNQDRVMMVQFHQSYTYEDFIEGYRPASGSEGFEIKKGAFYNFCRKAANDLGNDYFFIIDEINRGNLSKIFGELFMLIESDKRGNELQLLYSDENFLVPDNVYIIGMMNTADRSLAMLDYALRRRFAFFSILPGFNTDGFRKYKETFNNESFIKLISCIEELNANIAADSSLGDGFCIGHSYFCGIKTIGERTLSNIIEYEIIPLLNEYWYDEPIKVRDWADRLRGSIK